MVTLCTAFEFFFCFFYVLFVLEIKSKSSTLSAGSLLSHDYSSSQATDIGVLAAAE